MALGCFPIGAGMLIKDLERDPHPLLAELRASEPVSWLPVLDGWLVTGYRLALAVLRDAETFTVDDPRFSTARLLGPNMLSLDGTAHARHRDPFARPFRPVPVRERLTGFVHSTVEHLLATIMPNGRAELRAEFAGPLAVAVMAETLGLPDVDATTIRCWYQTLVAAVSDLTAGRPADASDVRKRLRDSVTAAGDSALFAAARTHGLDDEQVAANAAVLMFGGIDTTEGMITNAIVHLLDHPDQHALVLQRHSSESVLVDLVCGVGSGCGRVGFVVCQDRGPVHPVRAAGAGAGVCVGPDVGAGAQERVDPS